MNGRPPIWSDPIEFENAVDAYFKDNEVVTWTGLTIHLGFESRQSLEDYKKKEGFSYPIKKALLRIENKYEIAIEGRSPAGAIFALKNFGWKDKQELVHTTKGESIKNEIDYSKLSEQTLREIASFTDKGED